MVGSVVKDGNDPAQNGVDDDAHPADDEGGGRTVTMTSPDLVEGAPSPITNPPPPMRPAESPAIAANKVSPVAPRVQAPSAPRPGTAGAVGGAPRPRANEGANANANEPGSAPRVPLPPPPAARRPTVMGVAPPRPMAAPMPPSGPSAPMAAKAAPAAPTPAAPRVHAPPQMNMPSLGEADLVGDLDVVAAPEDDEAPNDGPTMNTPPDKLDAFIARPPAAAGNVHDKDAPTIGVSKLDSAREEEETTRAVSREELFRQQDAHVIVGEDAIGDEATLAVAPGSLDLKDLAGASAGLGPPLPPRPQPGAGGGGSGGTGALPRASSPHFDAPPSHDAPPMPPAFPPPPGSVPYPPHQGTQAMQPPPGMYGAGGGAVSSGHLPAAPQTPPSGPWHAGAHGPQMQQMQQMQQGGMGQPPPSAPNMPYGQPPPWMQAQGGQGQGQSPPMQAGVPTLVAAKAKPPVIAGVALTPQVLALIGVGVVCLAIFAVGIYLFVSTF